MTEKVIKRGYVKWTDEDGVFHKEMLADHPELLAQASPKEKLAAEEARLLNAAAVAYEYENQLEVQEALEEADPVENVEEAFPGDIELEDIKE